MGRHAYINSSKKFVKVTVELEEDIYNKIIDIRLDYTDNRSLKEIVNYALREYLLVYISCWIRCI